MPKRRKKDDSKTINDLSGAFKDSVVVEGFKLEIKRLKELVDGQNKMIDQLAAQISAKDEYIRKVEGSGAQLSSNMTDEEIIARNQLEKLKQKAMLGELTLDETRKYDLLVKNKISAVTNAPIVPDYSELSLSGEKNLLELASKSIRKKSE